MGDDHRTAGFATVHGAPIYFECAGPRSRALPYVMIHAGVECAVAAGGLERVCELEMQIWFDGVGRGPQQVDATMRRLAYDMNHVALEHAAKRFGTRLRDSVGGALG